MLNLILSLLILLAEPVYGVETFHTCGVDDKVFVGEYDGRFEVDYDWVMDHKNSVVEIEGCSGTLIADDLVITAAHCPQVRKGATVQFNYEVDETPDIFHVEKVLEKGRYLDYKIFRVSGNPGVTPQKIACVDDLQIGEEV